MKIAFLSGKGGAGKTFVAVNLATAVQNCSYIDCDVEEPNGNIFFKPNNIKTEFVYKSLPSFNKDLCIGCKKCVQFCKFNALAYIKEKPIVFTDVCHNCGGCKIVCPNNAVTEIQTEIGRIETGKHQNIDVITGILNIGQSSGVPVINKALEKSSKLTIIDCPPGSACSVLETVMDCDYCVLVAEPTAFGFHNIKMVHELVTLLKKPCGIIVNKMTETYTPLEDFCKENNIEILDRIMYDPIYAQCIANGEIIAEKIPSEKDRFLSIFEKIGGKI